MKKKMLLAALMAGALLVPSMSYAAEGETVEAPQDLLMSGAEAAGVKQPLDDLKLKLYGWVEAGYSYGLDSPTDKNLFGRVFDFKDNHIGINQTVLRLERALSDGNGFDVGGMVELSYGTDMRFIHQNGLLSHENGADETYGAGDPEYQFDPTQFYGLVRFPVGEGLTAKFGKFVTPMGYEVIAATGNPLYSHSYLFNYAIPFTHTGVQLDYPLIKDALNVYYGINRGWDQFDDNNSTMSHMLGAYGKFDGGWGYFANFIIGPERAKENTDWRAVLDGTVTYSPNDQWTFALNGDVGYEPVIGNDPIWWGIAGYATYKFHSQISTTVRAEYFHDGDSFRTAAFDNGDDFKVFALTAGLDIYPIASFRNLRIRPEVRWDHSFDGRVFNQPTPLTNQVTFGGDIILTF
jgi:hypothetical protein